MRVLVTGGAGYIGSHAVRRLVQRGHQVWVWDDLSAGHAAAVQGVPLLMHDLRHTDALDQALREHRIEAVMHFAASALVGESVRAPEKYYQNNLVNSLNLLRMMRRSGVLKFVFSSTCAIYGVPHQVPIREEEPPKPINPYGRSKLGLEFALADYATAYGLAYAALRYFNAAGAAPEGDIGEDHTPESHLIPLVLQTALGQRPHIEIFGSDYPTPDGTCIRDYIHVDDLADAHILALEKLQPGQALRCNLGTGRGHSVREVIRTCAAVTGRKIPTLEKPRRPGDPPELVAANDLARQQLGWQPRYVDLEGIIASAWRWHVSHPHGYGK
jgi:UDP-glucose-4-epimerase GalE